MFQSPRSGKFVSNVVTHDKGAVEAQGFNPLDRGNLYLIKRRAGIYHERCGLFQSPRSGKFVSNLKAKPAMHSMPILFQSPRSGKFVSNSLKNDCELTTSFKRTTLCRHYITNGKMFENVAKKIFQIRTLLLIDSLR